MFYFVKMPSLLRRMYSGRVWDIATQEKVLYLTFDDGPHPIITEKVLDLLSQYSAKACFFCVGTNVQQHSETYSRIINEGHSIGNHTMQHLNASKVKDGEYLQDIRDAKVFIDSKLFRPPYGRLSSFLQKQIEAASIDLKVVMWSILSGDFDTEITAEKCRDNVLLNAKGGDIIVFHDSEKAQEKMLFALEATLKYFSEQGFKFEALSYNLVNKELEK